MKNILFVCTGNSCRSVMAEGIFKQWAAEKKKAYRAASAGIFASDGYGPTGETVRAMEAVGIDVRNHRSRRLTPEMVRQADHIYVMELMHQQAILTGSPEAHGKVHLLSEYSSDAKKREDDINIPDPIRMSDSFYNEVLGVIKDCVQNVFKTLEASS